MTTNNNTSSMRALIINSDEEMLKTVSDALTEAGFVCDKATKPEVGIEKGKMCNNDIIITELSFPKANIDGYEVLLCLRSSKVKTPILILSHLTSSDQIVKALRNGADDYMTTPAYNKEELIERIYAITRRSKGHSESVIRFDKVTLNLDTRIVEVDGKPVHLTNKEYAIFELLAMRKGTVLNKATFLNHLYGGVNGPEIKIIDVFICKLRKRLAEASGGVNYIETVWGRGYMLKDFDYVTPNTNTNTLTNNTTNTTTTTHEYNTVQA